MSDSTTTRASLGFLSRTHCGFSIPKMHGSKEGRASVGTLIGNGKHAIIGARRRVITNLPRQLRWRQSTRIVAVARTGRTQRPVLKNLASNIDDAIASVFFDDAPPFHIARRSLTVLRGGFKTYCLSPSSRHRTVFVQSDQVSFRRLGCARCVGRASSSRPA